MNLAELMGGMDTGDTSQYPTSEELAKIREEFVHIEGLKAGDKLKWKSPQYKDHRLDGVDGVFEVFRVLPSYLPGGECGSSTQTEEADFTIITYEDEEKKITELALDSRRFSKV
jgi:hypothetical protein